MTMEQTRRMTLIYDPMAQVIATWVWIVGLPLLLLGTIVASGGDLTTVRQWWREHQYVQAYFEMITAGLLPVLFVWLNKENPARYGFTRHGLARSIGLSLLVVGASYVETFLRTGQWINFAPLGGVLSFPQNLWYAAWGVFANGPLEVFFVVWLITKTDQVFESESPLLSRGFLVTLALFSLLHILTTQSLVNAAYVFVIWFFLGLIYKATRNIVGPMLGWTLINGMVWSFIAIV
jgi:membrane protease YdiL (CAAX protease family)